MLKDNYEFSVEGMKALRSDIKELTRDIKESSKVIEEEQVRDYVTQLQASTPADVDHKVVVKRPTKYNSIVEQSGEQVIFSEFGTGWYGEINPRHPQEGEVNAPDGEPYEVNKTQKDSFGWTYMDKDGEPKWTLGEPAGMQNYKAFQYVRQNHDKYRKMWLKGVK